MLLATQFLMWKEGQVRQALGNRLAKYAPDGEKVVRHQAGHPCGAEVHKPVFDDLHRGHEARYRLPHR